LALRLIVDREREIRAFEKREYWTIDAHLGAKKPPVLTARLAKRIEETIEIPDEAAASEHRRAAHQRFLPCALGATREKTPQIQLRRSLPPLSSRSPPASSASA
jgi:DNA topoisomerase IA